MPGFISRISEEAQRAIHASLGVAADPVVRETNEARFGQYQINGVLPLAKVLKDNPRKLATQVLEALDFGEMFLTPEIAGPGFINLRFNPEWVGAELGRRVLDRERLGISRVEKPETIVVDFSSPNIAKRMHVGHLRSTGIGDALVRTLRFLGHRVIGDNHVGDWGTQFGILIWAWRNVRSGDDESIAALESLYQKGSEASKNDPEVAEACRAELAKLQTGDPDNVALWERFVAISRREAEITYERLDVSFEEWLGESHYHDRLGPLTADLEQRGIARESEGALVVFFPEDDPLAERPFLIRKSDGAYLYSTSDIATILYRIEVFHASRMIYVVDVRQSLHFKQLFRTASMMGVDANLEHVGFGMMLGADGRPFRTRDGGTVTLEALLNEAEERILPIVRDKWPNATPEEQRHIAGKVGIGAVKYADLGQNLTTDYKFEWDKLLAADGNTGPYLQYTLVRIRSVLRELEARTGETFVPDGSPISLEAPEELELGLELMKLGDALDRVGGILRPHLLCEALYAIARKFNPFYAKCPILKAEDDVRRSRLALCAATARALEIGLACLNIPTLERM